MKTSTLALTVLIVLSGACVVSLGILFTVVIAIWRWSRGGSAGYADRWAHAAYSIWSGGEDSATWPADRAAASLKDWYGITNKPTFWKQIEALRGGQTGNPAWDQVRAIDLLRMGVAAGYIDAEECRDSVRSMANHLRETYTSWETLAAGFEAGMNAWQDRSNVTDAAARGRVQRNLPYLRSKAWPAIRWDADID